MTDAMKQEFGHSQRVLDNRHYDQMMQKEKDLSLKLEEMQRRMENESLAREKTVEDNFNQRLRTQQERFQQ